MNKRLPLDDFENDIQKLADGFEIKPRSIVFENIRYELSAGSSLSASKSGKVIKTVFSKGLTFVGYAAAAAALTVSTVFLPQSNKISEEENLKQYHKNKVAYSTQLPAESKQDSLAVFSEPVVAEEMNKEVTSINGQEKIETPEQNLSDELRADATPATTRNSSVLPGNIKAKASVHPRRNSKDKQKNTVVTPPLAVINSATRTEEKEVIETVNEKKTDATPTPVSTVTENTLPEVNEEKVFTFSFPDTVTVTLRDTLAKVTSTFKTGAWSVAAFYSYDQIANTYTYNKALLMPAFDTYQAFRNRTQQTSYGYRAGVKVDYSLLNHLSIGSGINFSKVTDKISVERNFESIYDTTKSIWVDEFYTNPGYQKVVTNSYQYLEIPLTISYSGTLYKQIACRVTAGAGLGYLFGTSSYFLIDKFNDPFKAYYAKATGVSGSTPFAHTMINLNLSAYVSYLANKRLEVFAGPNIRKSVSSMYKKNYSATQKFTTFGSEVGVRFFF